MKKKLGKQGEETAARYFLSQGYKILTRNFFTRYGELDIVCEKDKEIIFVEVKTRSSLKFGTPEEAITPKKIEHLRKAALIYLDSLNRSFTGIRFDVFTILLNDKKESINHIKNAF